MERFQVSISRISFAIVASSMMFAFWHEPALALDKKTIFREASRAVVLVTCADAAGNGVGQGTGAIIREDGMIVTNDHVVSMDDGSPCPIVAINFKPSSLTGGGYSIGSGELGPPKLAALVSRYRPYDLALLKVEEANPLVSIAISARRAIEVGSDVLAIGHPGGGSLWTLTSGTISSAVNNYRGTSGYHIYQTDAALNPGNSGGPLIDEYGELVGINTFIARESGSAGLALDGLGFASQSASLRKWLGDNFFEETAQPKRDRSSLSDDEARPAKPPEISRAAEKNLAEFLSSFTSADEEVAPRKPRASSGADQPKPKREEHRSANTGLNDFLKKFEQ